MDEVLRGVHSHNEAMGQVRIYRLAIVTLDLSVFEPQNACKRQHSATGELVLHSLPLLPVSCPFAFTIDELYFPTWHV